MKTFKILFAALIIAGFATTAMATDNQATASAEARVLQDISFNNVTDIDFGGVAANSDVPSLDPITGAVANAGLGEFGTSIGKFTIEGTADAEVTISFSTDAVDLTLDGGSETISYTPEFSYLAGITGATFGGEALTTSENLDDSGEGSIFVGGSLSGLNGASAGVYSNDEAVQITVEYN